MNETRWLSLMSRLGFADNLGTYSQLQSKYNEKHRHYHNCSHIKATLDLLGRTQELADDYDSIEIALWFHDAIYKTFSSTNELDSANWAAEFLKENNADSLFIDKVHRLIMVTLHDSEPTDNDEKLIIDIDLSILGCESKLYEQFETWVRREYKLIPSFIYKKRRKEILGRFLDRDRIYSHDYFFETLENSARENLKNAIKKL